MFILGTVLGFLGAFAQSVSYLFSRQFIKHEAGGWWVLMAVSHVLVGLMLIPVLPFLCNRSDIQLIENAIVPVIGVAGFYFVAQAAFFAALKRVEASRVSPLLGVKVVFLALLVTVLGRQNLGWQSWLAVLMSASAAFFLNEIGGRIPLKALLFIALTLLGYSLSDINISDLLKILAPTGRRGPFIAVCLSYLPCALFGALMLVKTGMPPPRTWLIVLPYSVAWLLSMILFYWSIEVANLVFATIVQATRGIISIWLAVFVSGMGMVTLESQVGKGVFFKRLVAATFMVAAIALYSVYRK